MSLSDALLGAAVGIGARVAQGISNRSLLRESSRRRTQSQDTTQAKDPLQQEYDKRLEAEYQRRQAQVEPTDQAISDEALMQEYARRQESTVAPNVMGQLQELWVNARGDPDIFRQWMLNNPDFNIRLIAENPSMMRNIIEQLQGMDIQEPEVSPKGVPNAPMGSSNVKGFGYDEKTGNLTVQFQGKDGNGGVYQYGGVPPFIAKAFMSGSASAKTDGENQFGSWWKGKNPSLGAAHWQFIRDNFPYQKVA